MPASVRTSPRLFAFTMFAIIPYLELRATGNILWRYTFPTVSPIKDNLSCPFIDRIISSDMSSPLSSETCKTGDNSGDMWITDGISVRYASLISPLSTVDKWIESFLVSCWYNEDTTYLITSYAYTRFHLLIDHRNPDDFSGHCLC